MPCNKVTGALPSENQKKPFQCPCGKKFPTPTGLRSHQRDARRARPEKCHLAEKSLGTSKKKAIPNAESKGNNLTCGCGRTFPTLGALQHHQDDKANPDKCRPRDPVEPQKAVVIVSQTQPLKTVCGCGRKFENIASIQQHQQKNQESWTCHTYECVGQAQAVQTNNSVGTDGLQRLYKPFQCACERKFGTALDLQYHQNQWSASASAFDGVKCLEGIATYLGRPFDPSKATTDQGAAEFWVPQQSYAPSGQAQVFWTERDIGQHLDTILPSSIQQDATQVSSKQGYLVLGSYNWSSAGRGKDAYFVPVPTQLPPDTNLPPMDTENAQDLPDYPYQASLEAIKIMKPDWRFNDVDILADWKVLRALLTLTAGKQGKAFRMKLYLVRNTLVVEMRSERAETWRVDGEDPVRHAGTQLQYGRSLEPTFTRWDARLEKSEAYVRTIQYSLGPLRCVVRFQADACYMDPQDTGSTGPGANDSNKAVPNVDTVDEVTVRTKKSVAKHMTWDPALGEEDEATALATATSNITIRGNGTPQEHMIEIKTKSYIKVTPNARVTPSWMSQLWFSRVANLIVGEHTDGLLQHIQHQNDMSAGGVWQQWEEEENNQVALRKLVSLLSELRALVAEHAAAAGGYGAVFAVYDREVGGPGLRLYEAREDREAPLPEDLIKSLWRVDEWGV